MKPANKQMALKAALFVVLAANFSWHGAKSFHSSDMASELGTVGASVPARFDAPPAVRLAPPANAPALNGPKPDAAISAQAISVKQSYEFKMICSVPIKIHFRQETEAGKEVVHADVTNRLTNKDMQGLREEGTYADIIGDAGSKAQWEEIIHSNVVDTLKAQGKDCSAEGKSVANGPQSPTAPQDPQADKIATGLQNCTLDKNGNPLKSSARYTCNLAKLQALSLDTGDSDDQDDRVDSRGRIARRRRDSSTGLARVMSLLTPLENSIKGLLLSSNDDKRDEGESRLDDVVSTLETVKDTASNSSDERAMTRLIEGLQKGYVLGEKVARTAAERSEQMQALDDRIMSTKISAAGGNVYQQMAVQQQIQMLQMQKQQLQQSLSSNTDFLQLRAMNQQGLITALDFADFTADYNSLLGLNGGGSTNGLMTAPQDILQARQAMAGTDPRNISGLANPAFPQLNYSQLGLQNPSLIGGQNTFMPTSRIGYPQTSGYPVMSGVPTMNAYPSTIYPGTSLPMANTASFQTVPGRLF